ncbi:MAG TPA: hypothetical protein VM864_09425 [Pyrinomonadaceae bacterium]|jgi:hypothetical protein|nr:hypothetical protein [Pyrinomonadaceae bacterium]
MTLPGVSRLELPILQELVATGGADDVRFLYQRLVAYFPHVNGSIPHSHAREDRQWRRHVQCAGRALDEKRQIERRRGFWSITLQGRRRVDDEGASFSYEPEEPQTAPAAASEFSHVRVQEMLMEVGRALGFHAAMEFDYYDVVWREGESSPRISHVFEVQRKGNVDAALAKLKRAYESQRSRPFFVVASERDTNRAQLQMSLAQTGAFHEIGRVTTILSFEQLDRLHRALVSVEDLLAQFIER